MDDRKLADIIIQRLNLLIHDPDISQDVRDLLDAEIMCSKATANHNTIQVTTGLADTWFLGFLGLLNGIVGTCQTENGRKGLITAVYSDDGELLRFERTV